MIVTDENENLFRGCIQEAQIASFLLTQAIVAIGECASPQTPSEERTFRLLRVSTYNINLLLTSIPLTGQEDICSWPTI
jgi:hypothetical protein